MDTAPWGGSEELWSLTAERLAREGAEVGVNVWRWPQPARQIAALKAAGCSVSTRRTIRRLRAIIGNYEDRRVCNWLDVYKPEIVVLSMSYHIEGLEWMQACARRNIPYALLIESAGEPFWPGDADARELAKFYEQAAACFFVSQGNLNFVRTQFATPLTRGKVVRNPFNVRYDASPEWPDQNGVWKLACIGRLQPMAKGQDILFDVLQSDKWKQRPLEVTLYGDGPNKQALIALKEMFGLDRVTFGGFNSDIEALWRQHHGLVLSSRYEGLPLVVVEAMLCGRPCIVTDVAGNAELMEDNVSGFVATGANTRQLDEAMERAWSQRENWREIGKAAATRVRHLVPSDPIGVFADAIRRLG